MEARGHTSRERRAGPADSPGESTGGEEGSRLVRGSKEPGQAQHTHSPAQGRRGVEGLSLNAVPGQGLETQVRLVGQLKPVGAYRALTIATLHQLHRPTITILVLQEYFVSASLWRLKIFLWTV